MSDAVTACGFWEAQHCSVQTLALHPDRRCPPCTEKQPETQSTVGILLSDPAPEAQHPMGQVCRQGVGRMGRCNERWEGLPCPATPLVRALALPQAQCEQIGYLMS